MDDNEELYAFWTQLACGISNSVCRKIFTRFSSFREIYECEDFSFLNGKYACESKLKNKDLSEAYELRKKCASGGIHVIPYYSAAYPVSLKLIQAPPAILYALGQMRDLNELVGVAVVGTRSMTPYGAKVAEDFAYYLSICGATVVSGLAKGIDTCAHRGAIRAGGYTIGVLGTPIDEIYPKENLKAFQTLYERGLVVSEMYPGCRRTRADFPNRNRIISGLCDATLIVEAGEHSGALITASHAIYQGRLVYAIPGALGDEHAGTNRLIRDGVRAATCAEDILNELALSHPTKIFPENILSTPRIYSYGYTGPKPSNPIKVPVMHRERKQPPPESPPDAKEEIPEEKPPKKPEAKSDKAAFPPVEPPENAPAKPAEAGTPAAAADECDTLEGQILSLLRYGPATTDSLTASTGAETGELLAALTILEIDGRIRSSAGNIITLNEI